MTHLTPDELIDAMEGMLAPDRQVHLSSCAECQRQVDELASTLTDARQTSVPDPSPLFWNQFAARVNDAIDSQGSSWPQWLRWQLLLPIGAAAVIVAAVLIQTAGPTLPDGELAHVAAGDPDALIAPASDDNWGAIAAIVGELDLETASAAGVIAPGVAEQAVLSLTAEEQQELTRLLQAELARAKS